MVAESRDRADEPEAARCPAVQGKVAETSASRLAEPLNEVSPVSELDAMRMLLTRSGDAPEE